ncbi:MAG TPA: amino acid adenylation domain-containing protein, partial [Albitalea sp.]|nr:amino acid adenylation domain-containing protein [Albitalea sp.]
KTSGQTDLVVGMPVHGRRDFAECHDLVGMFANTVAVRFEVQPGESFRDMLRRIGQTLRDDLSHSHAPLEQVVRELQIPRDLSRSPVYQAFFGFQDIRDRTSQWDGLHLQPYTVPITAIAEDINCMMTERADGLAGLLSYSVDLFSPASARAFAERYRQLVERLSTEPDAPIEAVTLSSSAELRRMQSWNDTTSPYDRHASVHGLIAARAALRPADPALHMGRDSVSHGELDARANRLAQLLRSRGIGRGALVGLCVERSVAMVVAQLAVLKAGAAYVPLDPAYPANRLATMAEDAQLALLISESALQDRLEWPRERSLLLDIDAAAIARQPDAALAPDAALDARPEDPAYVIYTSGSTGKPKGVIVQHRAAVNFLASMARTPGLTAADRLVAVTTLSFDIAVLELLLPLTVGAQVYLASRDETTDGQALRALLESSRATVMQATPATWRMLIDAGWQGTRGFKALIGGEGLPSDLAHQLLERVAELWNMYGPTETTVWSTCWKVEQIDSGISIGQPIANTQVHILDERGEPCPIGVPGEIYIGGDGVTLGYLNRPELTAERFVPDPFNRAPGARLYRTGDRGRWRHDGLLEHMGRLDFQVKVRGHRIELGEIESNLATHPQVARTVVIVREDRPGDVRLVAYVVARDAMPAAAELREHLRANQPEYSLPQHFVPLEAIPLLPNGKINRHALPAPADDAAGADTPYDAPRNDAEAAMAEIWQQLLGIARVSVTANFFDLGGHSMLAMRLVAQVHKRFGKKLPLAALLERGSIRQLVASLSHTDAARNSLVLIRPGGTRPPVFLVHDGIGETLLYRSLAYCLDAGHAVYGLQPRSEDGYAMLHSRISEMAAYHVEKIRSVQPHGPYLLGGLCAGGVIAFEIARQLQARGETIAMVALLDAADAAAE